MKLVGLMLILCPIWAYADFPPEPTAADFRSAETGFKYHGKFINPRLVKLFEGFASDTGVPVITSVDVAAAYGTNQFSDENVVYENSGARFDEDNTAGAGTTTKPQFFNYKWIGRLNNGTHVVESTSGGGGGTMISKNLFFFKISEGSGRRPAANPRQANSPTRLLDSKSSTDTSYKRLLLSVERYYIIGDRVPAEYSIKGNSVVVQFTNQEKPLVKTIDGN